MRLVYLFISVLILTACTKQQINTLDGPPLQDRLTGEWGWSNEHCNSSPDVMSFSEDGSTMFVERTKIADTDNNVPDKKTTTYRIIKQSSKLLTVAMDGEQRLTDKGKTVVWDVRLVSANRFCLHRTDWPETRCTAHLRRCI